MFTFSLKVQELKFMLMWYSPFCLSSFILVLPLHQRRLVVHALLHQLQTHIWHQATAIALFPKRSNVLSTTYGLQCTAFPVREASEAVRRLSPVCEAMNLTGDPAMSAPKRRGVRGEGQKGLSQCAHHVT